MTCLWWMESHSSALVFPLPQARLYSLQADPATYCNEPDGRTSSTGCSATLTQMG